MSMAEELERVALLHRQGTLTEDEFRAAKTRIIQGGGEPGLADGIAALLGGQPGKSGLVNAAAVTGKNVMKTQTVVIVLILTFATILMLSFPPDAYPFNYLFLVAFYTIALSIWIYPRWLLKKARQAYNQPAGLSAD